MKHQCLRGIQILALTITLAFVAERPAGAQVTLISTGAVWKYLDDGSDPGATWSSVSFSDAGWASGPAPLGYGDANGVFPATTNSFGSDPNNKYITTYYRSAFNIPDASSITNLRALLKRDDGAVVYLNGVEVFRSNMPTGSITSATLATSVAIDDGSVFFPSPVSTALLANGNNVVAVEIHQAVANSSDINFDFELTGNPLPTISIDRPTDGQVIVANNVAISGTAIPAASNLILVEAFAGETKVGESTDANFNILWQNVAPGSYTLTARVTESSGLVAMSVPVNITVQALPASMLVPRGSSWKYNNSSNDLTGTGWQQLGYDDSAWSGPVPGPVGDNVELGVQLCQSFIDIGPPGARLPVVYYRRTFTVPSANLYQAFHLRLNRDDTAFVYLNGARLYNDGVPEPVSFSFSGGAATGGADETNYFDYIVSSTALVDGLNVLAVENHQQQADSSDLQFDLELEGVFDTSSPLASYDPVPHSVELDLTFINVTFNRAVTGVNAFDLLINNEAATSVVTNDPNNFTFYFPRPATGTVQVTWAPNNGITDTLPFANPFVGGSWTYRLDTNYVTPTFVISEFMADNSSGLKDDDGNHSDWIEVLNMGTLQSVLDGWFLTDTPTNLTKWAFPPGMPPLQPNASLLVWASAKNRTNPLAPLHTNFKLAREAGNYLALVDPQTNAMSAFDPYPLQQPDISYGRDVIDPLLVGYYATPTPGKQNSTSGSGFVPDVLFSVDSGIYTNDSLTLTLSVSNAPPGTTIRYIVNPATSTNLPLASSLVYTGAITFTNNTVVKARAFPPDTTTLFPGAIIARNYLFLDNTDKDFNSNLPLMVISTQGRGIPSNVPPGSQRVEGSLVVIDTSHGRSSLRGTPDYLGSAAFELYGQTSIGFAKPPVRIEIHDALGNDLHVPLLGLPAESDWKLRNPFDDKTLLNDFLGFELFEQMGHYSVRRLFVETFIDTGGGRLTYPGDYVGVELLVESIKIGNNRVNVPKLTTYNTNEPAITGGYIFKKDKDSDGDINFLTGGGTVTGVGTFPQEALKIHEPKPNDLRIAPGVTTIWPTNVAQYTAAGSNQLSYLVGYLNQLERSLYSTNWLATNVVGTTNHYSNYIDVDSFVDFHWVVEFSKQIDGIRLSDYFTKDRGGKVQAGPAWDWNLSFGNGNYLRGGQTDAWYYAEQDEGITANEHIWLRRLINGGPSMGTGNTPGPGGDPEFNQKIVDRWSVLRTNVLNGTNVVHRIDELSTTLNEAAGRDLWGKWRSQIVGVYQWPNPDGVTNGTAGTYYVGANRLMRSWDIDYQHPTNYLGDASNSIIGQMKTWVLGRYLWIDNQFTPQPAFSAGGGLVTNGFSVTVSPRPGATLYYTLDGTDPRAPGGGVMPGVFTNNGPTNLIINSNVRIFARARNTNSWYNTWSGPASIPLFTTVPPLRITEIMYHPAATPAGSLYSTEVFEYIEVKNIGATPLNVNRFSLSGGVQFDFPNVVLAAGQSAVLVANSAAFQSRYGNGPLILGTYSGHLNNSGDHLMLSGSLQEAILDFSYKDGWYPATDGLGFSLAVLAENAPTTAWDSAGNWRASSGLGGSPGQDDPAPPLLPAVLVNEVLTNEDPPAGDAIELFNPTGIPADLSGWFLTDDFNTPKKFTIPANTMIAAGGFVVFYATNSFGANGTNSFGLSAKGDQVYVFSGNGVDLTGYAHGFDFGVAAKDVTFGRYVLSTGKEHFVAQAGNSLGEPNTGPLVGPIVISEINYHPPDSVFNGIGFNDYDDEFIELQNITASPVPLYDTTNTWLLRNVVDYQFPSGVILPPGGFLLVVGFDPAADATTTASFRARNSVPSDLALYGPWQHSLDNGGAAIELARPDVPTTNDVPYVLVDRVEYSDAAPWPFAADGFGQSLQRLVPSSYGSDPTNWIALSPSPGANYALSGTPPAITSQPGNRLVPYGTDVFLSAGASGTGPLHYQWRFNSLNLPGATNSMLVVTNFQFSLGGVYNFFVYNGAGTALGTNFNLSGRVPLRILTQPTNTLVKSAGTTNFTVVTAGTGTLRYRWRFNGADVLNGTNAILTITNVQPANTGNYDCVVSDDFDTTVSQIATLVIMVQPVFILHPVTQSAVAGSTVTLTAAATGIPAPGFRWRKPATLVNGSFNGYILVGLNYSILTLTNINLTNAATYTVFVTNLVGQATGGPSSGLSSNAVLTVLADTDGDGLPDDFQTAHPGIIGAGDEDLDGMSNAAEYFAGTDPFDPASNLKAFLTPGGASVQFTAVSNRTYSVQYTDSLNPIHWNNLSNILAHSFTSTQSVADPNPRTNRLYRIVTPIQP